MKVGAWVAVAFAAWGCGARTAMVEERGEDGPADGGADADADADGCPSGTGWRTETVAAFGKSPFIALGDDRAAHLLYVHWEFEWGPEGPAYATDATGSWTTELLETGVQVQSVALVARASKTIAAYGVTDGPALQNGRLVVASRVAGGFDLEVLDESPYTFPELGLAVDGDGLADVVYSFSERGDRAVVRHASNRDGVWTTTTLQDEPTYVACTCIAVDSIGTRHLLTASDVTLTYLVRQHAGWSLASSTRRDAAVSRCSLVLDQSDQPHALYTVSGEVVHAVIVGETWEEELTGMKTRDVSAAALAPDGSLHFAFVDEEDGRVLHATSAAGGWEAELVAPAGEGVTMAIRGDELHIAYSVPTDVPDPWQIQMNIVHAVRCVE